MNAQIAVDLLHGEVPGSVTFRNMTKALQLHSWLNTPEQAKRLEACLWARSHRNAIIAEMDRRRNLRRPHYAAYLAMVDAYHA